MNTQSNEQLKTKLTKKHKRVQLKFNQPSLTKQEYKQETDINFIINRFKQTGELPPVTRPPLYADVSNIPDFHAMHEKVRLAQESFNALPADLRAKFHNDPHEMLEWAKDPKNYENAVNTGILQKPEEKIGQNSPKNDKIEVSSTSK